MSDEYFWASNTETSDGLLYDNILFSSHMEIWNMIISITGKHGMFV